MNALKVDRLVDRNRYLVGTVGNVLKVDIHDPPWGIKRVFRYIHLRLKHFSRFLYERGLWV